MRHLLGEPVVSIHWFIGSAQAKKQIRPKLSSANQIDSLVPLCSGKTAQANLHPFSSGSANDVAHNFDFFSTCNSNIIANMFKVITSVLLLMTTASAYEDADREIDRELGRFHSNLQIKITVTNIAYAQPMSPFFYMSHSGSLETPLFALGEESSSQLRNLAENGNNTGLLDLYQGDPNVLSIGSLNGTLPPGQSANFTVEINRNFPYISFATMAVNTNDCFVGINSQFLYRSQTISVPGYDSGTEENNELCSSIPGPACSMDSGNVESGNGEGFVHVHRGVHGIG